MLSIGFGSYVMEDKIISIQSYVGAKLTKEVTSRKKEDAKGKTYLQDCTRNHAVKSVIICTDGTYILSSVSTETLAKRLNRKC